MPLRSPQATLWLRGFITCLTYTLAGLLAVSLAAPNEVASPLYLPAGLALGFVMGWGPWMIPAAGLGATFVTLINLLGTQPWTAMPTALSMGLLGGAGAALQVWGAWRITRAPDQSPLTLDKPAQIGRFLVLAGPVACLINASVSVGALVALGVLPLQSVPQTFMGWWAGDALGVLVGTPMMLTLVGQPASLWRARRDQVGLPLLITTVLLALAVRQVQLWRLDRESAIFQQDVAAATNAIKLRLNSYVDALAALNSVFEASTQVERQEFAHASRYWLDNLQGVQALGWDERVRAPQLPFFEQQQQAEGLQGYRVFDAPARQVPQGPEVVAVRFVEPAAGNQVVFGFNVLSLPATREAFEQARREGKVVATRGFKLLQEPRQQSGVVVYQPVYKSPAFTPQARVQANLGGVFLALRMDDATAAMLKGLPPYLDACLMDASVPGTPLLGGGAACHAGATGQHSLHRTVVPIEFAGRQWQLLVWSAQPVPMLGQGGASWILAVGGVALAAALGTLLLVMTGHARRIEAAMEEARRQREAAEAANEAKSDFLSRMSHELRTPLNAVLGFAQVMGLDPHDPLSDSQRQRIDQIQQAGWHLLDLIDDVLDISRIDAGTLRLHAEPLRIRDELATVLKAHQAQADRTGVSVTVPAEVPAEWGVTADATRLRQILDNLLSNAIKFNQRGGRVTIEVSQHTANAVAPTLQIKVRDTGMGMSSDQLAQLFQPFNRLGREQGPTGGTGIGLVISRHLAQLMGGQLEADSQAGQGATFTLTLPASSLPQRLKHPGAVMPAETPATGATPRHRHVLYVEDNWANSEVVRAALSARPWISVSVAPTSEEGLAVLHDRLRGSKPDLILLDVHLPDASGQELLNLIKANPDTADIPVIMISADALPEQIDAALEAGACCYLTKPVQLPELLRQVDELLPI
jgi:signal transduction histidine kinase/ActR/RegA family two-component response regulator/sensor domain CHASE-containing protein